jgi:hypothetical protein
VIESARTLAAIEGSGAFLKALLCELVLVGVSMLAVSTRKMQILRVVILMGIATLSLLTTVGGPLANYMEARQHVASQAEEVSILKRVIEQKQTLLTRYLSTDRISGAQRLESEIASLSDRLTQLKNGIAEQRSEFTLALGFAITVLFRLVIMAANIIFSNRLGQLMRPKNVPTFSSSVATHPKLALIRGGGV